MRLLRYLKGTTNYGIRYTMDSYGRKSTSGYLFLLCGAISEMCSAYVAMASATQESVWLRQLRQLIIELTDSSTADSPTLNLLSRYQTSLHSRTSDARYRNGC